MDVEREMLTTMTPLVTMVTAEKEWRKFLKFNLQYPEFSDIVWLSIAKQLWNDEKLEQLRKQDTRASLLSRTSPFSGTQDQFAVAKIKSMWPLNYEWIIQKLFPSI